MKTLKNYKRKELKCIIVEDFETGRVYKIVEEIAIKNALEKYTENEITKIYNPTKEQKDEILSMFDVQEVDSKVVTKLDGIDVFIKVLPMLTDIPIDLEKEEDLEDINEIISNPNDVFELVAIEINDIMCNINLIWIENLKTLGKLPTEFLEALSKKEN